MIKFIPIKFNSSEFIEEIDFLLGTNEEFRTYDLVYLPMSFKIEKNLTSSSEDFKAEKNIYFNESLLYQKVISDSKEIGYDLYVKEVIGD